MQPAVHAGPSGSGSVSYVGVRGTRRPLPPPVGTQFKASLPSIKVHWPSNIKLTKLKEKTVPVAVQLHFLHIFGLISSSSVVTMLYLTTSGYLRLGANQIFRYETARYGAFFKKTTAALAV